MRSYALKLDARNPVIHKGYVSVLSLRRANDYATVSGQSG